MEKPVAELSPKRTLEKVREPVEIIAQINKLTQENKLKWRTILDESVWPAQEENSRISAVFDADYKGKTLRLISKSKKTLASSLENPWMNLFVRLTTPIIHDKETGQDFYWQKEVALELLDENGAVIWKAPSVTILNDLEASVKYQTTEPALRGFVEDIFADN